MSQPNAARPMTEDELKDPRAARRHKLQRLTELGIDPWGSRFDNRQLVAMFGN